MTNFRLFQTESVCRRQFQFFTIMAENSSNGWKTLWEKEKLLVMSNFSFSHSVFKRSLLQTRKIQGLFGEGLNCSEEENNKGKKKKIPPILSRACVAYPKDNFYKQGHFIFCANPIVFACSEIF